MPDPSEMEHLSFREELHAIDAVLAGQGIGMLSDLLVGDELKTGALIQAIDFKLSGFGFYSVRSSGHPREREIAALSTWLQSAR
jgi:LysR family glycine cleavage system transcriptional activator